MTEDFFEEQLPASKIKSDIVSSYFRQWSRVIMPHAKKKGNKIGYLDFFSGQGKYDDGPDSTPLVILKSAIEDIGMREMLVSVFNDKEKYNTDKLAEEIEAIENIKSLKYKPVINTVVIGDEVVEQLKKVALIPSLVFIDPFGYKGLTLDFIASAIKDWGCDCIFFFNYNRINAAINNQVMKKNVDAIFGTSNADMLRENVKGLNPDQREKLVLHTFFESLKGIKGYYSIEFKFCKEKSLKTSHFLIFVTKHTLGYHLMKETMARNCPSDMGIPTYEYNPQEKRSSAIQMDIFGTIVNPIDDLAKSLLQVFGGRELDMESVYYEHSIGKPFIKANYKAALLKLEDEGKIETNPPAEKRPKRLGKQTLADKVIITFT